MPYCNPNPYMDGMGLLDMGFEQPFVDHVFFLVPLI